MMKKMMKVNRRIATMLLVCVSAVSAVSATAWAASSHIWPFCGAVSKNIMWEQLSIENMTRRSDTILIGYVQGVGPSWEEQVPIIYTGATLSVSQFLKTAEPRNIVQVKTLGGRVGCLEMTANDASFVEGDEVLVFLQAVDDSGYLRVVSPGVFTIVNGTAYQGHTGTPLDLLVEEIKKYV